MSFPVCTCKSENSARSQLNFAQKHVCVSVIYINSAKSVFKSFFGVTKLLWLSGTSLVHFKVVIRFGKYGSNELLVKTIAFQMN